MASVITLVFLALGVSAQVPHWVKQKSNFKNPNIKSMTATVRSLQHKLAQPNSRRLQFGSPACVEKCPAVGDMIKAMMEEAKAKAESGESSEETKSMEEMTDEEREAAEMEQMLAMCPYADAIVCAQTEKACQEPEPEGHEDHEHEEDEEESDPDGFKCMCACPDMAKFDCATKDAIISCMKGANACTSTMANMGGPRAADLECTMRANKCEEKGEKLGECVGETEMGTWGGTCVPASRKGEMSDIKDKCCPILKEIETCYTPACLKGMLARNQLESTTGSAKKKEEMKKEKESNIDMGKTCSDTVSSMPTSEADFTATLDEVAPDPEAPAAGASTDDAFTRAVPWLGLVVAMVAYLI